MAKWSDPKKFSVTHSVVVRPRSYGVFNYTSALISYYASEDAKQVTTGYSTAPGEGNCTDSPFTHHKNFILQSVHYKKVIFPPLSREHLSAKGLRAPVHLQIECLDYLSSVGVTHHSSAFLSLVDFLIKSFFIRFFLGTNFNKNMRQGPVVLDEKAPRRLNNLYIVRSGQFNQYIHFKFVAVKYDPFPNLYFVAV